MRGPIARLLLFVGVAAFAWLGSAGRIASADHRALATGMVVVLAMLIVVRRDHRRAAIVRTVSDGLLAFAEQDYSIRIAVDRGADPGDLACRFNALGDRLRLAHSDVYQKELLLETVLRATPTAIVLENEAGRVIYANGTARELLGGDAPLEGRAFADVLGELAPEVREALASPADTLLSLDHDGVPAVYDIARRFFHLNTQGHRLTMIRSLGHELERREAEAWKNAIRVISHELSNSLAPISSLVSSARTLVGNPGSAAKLTMVFDTVAERARHLESFLDGFTSVARLPRPRAEPVAWAPVLATVQSLYHFTIEEPLPDTPGWFDPAQLQQVLINLVKNAHEAGSGDDVSLAVAPSAGGVLLCVRDRGSGMTEDVRRNALLPFYSTKKAGAGVGLSLCREIVDVHGGQLALRARDGGGTTVEIWLPGRPGHGGLAEVVGPPPAR